MIYLAIALLATIGVAILLVLRELRWRQRERALRDLLDGADALENQLQECRTRMHQLKAKLADLPEEMSGYAGIALNSDEKVQAALRDLLAHRLWIKQFAIEAQQIELDKACAALRESGAVLGQQLQRLVQIAEELDRAQMATLTHRDALR